ncbi:component of the polarisome [Nowakowskiella sp. JEL0078]|nr:component of the polarisome [Nowakowskiella sp. JEL0078]
MQTSPLVGGNTSPLGDASLETANAHYEALRDFLTPHLLAQKSTTKQSQQRASAKEKLSKLSKPQFAELSTDVYDELIRRLKNLAHEPFLPVREEFHPKRNQARQKLATLPQSRFKDLAIDVYFEIERRFPQTVQVYIKNHGDILGDQLKISGSNTEEPALRSALSPEVSLNSDTDISISILSSKPLLISKPATQTSESNVSSLDILMADLGNMLIPSSGNSANNTHISNNLNNYGSAANLQSIRSEYEAEIKELQLRVKELEQDKAIGTINSEKIRTLETKLADQIKINKELEAKISMVEKEFEKCRKDRDDLYQDYYEQQQTTNYIRAEASSLQEEIKILQSRTAELTKENEEKSERIRLLIEDVRWSINILILNSYLNKRLEADTTLRPNSTIRDDEGVISRSRVTAYQSAVEDLLRAARSELPASVLVATKSIVVACKSITEDTEQYESSATYAQLSIADREILAKIKDSLTNALGDLMTAAKLHATSSGNSPVSAVDQAATNLTAIIVDVLKILKIKGDSNGTKATTPPPEQSAPLKQTTQTQGLEVNQLKIYLEKQTDQIVQAIQALLLAMRAPISQSANPSQVQQDEMDFRDNVKGITVIVENLVSVSSDTLRNQASARNIQEKGEGILKKLEEANGNLIDLGKSLEISHGGQTKTVKQKLASSSYDIAKYVKELISLIE